jgi:hypothetical protein
MDKTVNADETVFTEQAGASVERFFPARSTSLSHSAQGGRKLLGYCSQAARLLSARANWLQSPTWIGRIGPQTWPGFPGLRHALVSSDHLQLDGHLSSELNHHTR